LQKNLDKNIFIYPAQTINIESAEKIFFIVIAKLRISWGNLSSDDF